MLVPRRKIRQIALNWVIFCITVLGLHTLFSHKAFVGPRSPVEEVTPICFTSAIAGAISSGLTGLCLELLQPLTGAKFCELSSQDLAKAK